METKDLYIWLWVLLLGGLVFLWRWIIIWRRSRFMTGAGRKQKAALLLLEEEGYHFRRGARETNARMRVDGNLQEKIFSIDLVVGKGMQKYPVIARYRKADNLRTVERMNECIHLSHIFSSRGLLFVNLTDKKIQRVVCPLPVSQVLVRAITLGMLVIVAFVLGQTV